MNCRVTDKQGDLLDRLAGLQSLPRPVYGRALSLPNQAIERPHAHPWVQLSYAARGVVSVETATARFVAPPNRAIWVPPGAMHRVACSANARINSLYLEADSVAPRPSGVLEVSPLLKQLIVAFSRLPVAYDEAGAAGRLVAVLLDQLAIAPLCDLMLPLPQQPRLVGLCQYLRRHPADQQSLAGLSRQLDVSAKTLSRDFRQQTGLSFRQWRRRNRLLAALPMLETGQRITDVALACGYDSLPAFCAAFRGWLGQTPGEFAAAAQHRPVVTA